ncbi:hypothetical protein [Caldilinea sp.]|uniref:hypothetical protein n=1 Tax=Caldilinea sp. TaxID=2293560 RepID=UPI002C903A2D|nr:hypothetical protein [Anaerolineales bacterium]HQY91286.1 hypothetical protein [Caldilinea sp.]HRA65235.1 hypothetical protein [Caldilinea sp.]
MLEQKARQQDVDSKQTRVQTLWQMGVTGLVFSTLFLILLRTYADPDLWGHLRFGLDTVAARKLAFTDPYSYLSTGQTWINHEWLAEVLMAIAWLGGQSAGLVALRMAVLALTLGLIYLHLTRLLQLSWMPSLAVLVLTVPGLVVSINVVRPQLFTFLLFTITLLVIYQADRGRYRWLWAMPVVVVAWVNLHGGFLAGGGLLGLWALLHLATHRAQWRAVLPPLLLSAAALLVNPYGFTLVAFLLETGTVARPGISDWQPVQMISWMGAVYLGLLGLSFVAIGNSRRPKRWDLLALFLFTALLPLTAVRHLPLMAIAFAMFVGEHGVDIWDRQISRRQRSTPLRPWLAGLPLLIALIIPFVALSIDRGRILIGDAVPYPRTALTLLKTSGFTGNLATFFDWGEYIIWHAGPQIKVSIDGRRETVYPPDIYQKHFNLWYGSNQWNALLTEYPTDAVLIVSKTATDNLLRRSPDWRLVYTDNISTLFINETSSAAQVIEQAVADFAPPPPQVYFP